ncbi:MAG: GDP-mannose 4,6-dehydratase [Thermoleophilaceae bacterium]
MPSLGTLDATRDWSFAGDVAEAMWLMVHRPGLRRTRAGRGPVRCRADR